MSMTSFETFLNQHQALYDRVFRRIMWHRYGRPDVRLFIVEGMSVQECAWRILRRRWERGF
jgi:hypothetical protein